MDQAGSFPLLTLTIFLPILGAAVSLLVSPRRRETANWLALLISAADLFISLFLHMGWIADTTGGLQFVEGPRPWIHSLGIDYHVGVDGLNLHLVLLTTLLVPLTLLAATLQGRDTPRWRQVGGWTLLFEGGVLGALASLNLALFVLFWIMALLALFFLLGGNASHPRTGVRFLAAIALPITLMLISTTVLYALQSARTQPELSTGALPWWAQASLFVSTTIAFCISGGIFPLHLVYIDVHRQAPLSLRILVSTLLLNVSTYGLLRLSTLLFPLAVVRFAPWMMIVGIAGIVYGALAALGQKTVPGALAYWNVSQMGLTVVGIFSLQDLGLHGAILAMIARCLSMAALLLLSSRRSEPGTVHSVTAVTADRAALALGFLSAIGLPGLAGFLGQSTLVLGVVRWHWNVSRVAALNTLCDGALYGATGLGILLGIWALMRAWRRTYIPVNTRISPQTVIALPLLFLILFTGLSPQPSSDIIGPSVYAWQAQINQQAERDAAETLWPASPRETEWPAPFPEMDRDSSVWAGTKPGMASP